jgi:hypothetical protein
MVARRRAQESRTRGRATEVDLAFLTPEAALVGLLGALPLGAFLAVEARGRRVRRTLRLPDPPRRSPAALFVAVAAVPALVAAAAAQPVLGREKTRLVRADAEAMFVLDTSRSMLATARRGAPKRFDRALAAAEQVRAKLPDIPVGIATMTDRALPHLFPTADESVFRATLRRSIGIERPPPGAGWNVRVTTLGALLGVATQGYFAPSARTRLLVVFSDFETRTIVPTRFGEIFRTSGVRPIFVHFWDPGERIFSAGVAEAEYHPDPTSLDIVSELAAATDGVSISEDSLDTIVPAARRLLGDGRKVAQGEADVYVALAPYFAFAAVLPLGLLLRRRNL